LNNDETLIKIDYVPNTTESYPGHVQFYFGRRDSISNGIQMVSYETIVDKSHDGEHGFVGVPSRTFVPC